MSKSLSLFSQVISLVSRNNFDHCVAQLDAEKASKGFRCWDQFIAMMFCQLAQAKSIREISDGLACCEGKLNHLGLDSAPKRSTLSYANKHRPWQLYEKVFYDLLNTCRKQSPGHKFHFKNKLLSLDSTLIELCVSLYDWAKYRQRKGAIKLHLILDHDGYLPCYALIGEGKTHDVAVGQQLNLPKGSIVAVDRGYNDYKLFSKWTDQGVYFVSRMKTNARYRVVKRRSLPKSSKILRDEEIELSGPSAREKCHHRLRRVVVWDERNQRELALISNQLTLSATTIGNIYKERWQIEIFFKAIKQNLKIKTFVGTSSNAVHIQIWTALIAMLLVKLLQMKSRISWSLSKLIALLRWNLFTYKNLWDWMNYPLHQYSSSKDDDRQLIFKLDST